MYSMNKYASMTNPISNLIIAETSFAEKDSFTDAVKQ